MPRGGSPRSPLGFEITARQWNCCNLVGPFRWILHGKEKKEEREKEKVEKIFSVGTFHPEMETRPTRSKNTVLRASIVAPIVNEARPLDPLN